ncbi:hypothetical protein GCM10018781_62240 [Kitasatospora indigofera]|uniref:Uncharacterized protein n=1 Tax=Kitasatospora indigofera TaxID=67307 RepID=A0A919GA93_9ACTN|nr:hypothetical protein GCM10018781_62240 [Kitasatospora indigofera]
MKQVQLQQEKGFHGTWRPQPSQVIVGTAAHLPGLGPSSLPPYSHPPGPEGTAGRGPPPRAVRGGRASGAVLGEPTGERACR